LTYIGLKKRIKKNEGFRNRIYLDQLNNKTIGYGHLIGEIDKFEEGKEYTKTELTQVFEEDFQRALNDFNKYYKKDNFKKKENEILIEMIFQLGGKGVLRFKKFINELRKKNKHMAALEMMDSLWYRQTKKRVNILISDLLGFNDKKRK
jgi:GH24 family phage-related lysozyme (muramidase)